MKGIIINEGSPLLENKYVNACYIKNGALHVSMTLGEGISYDLSGEKDKSASACCSKKDTYDFETGALIALMKMCGKEKALKAVKELYFLKEPRGADLDGDVLESKVEYMVKENERLKEKVDDLYAYNKGLIEEIDQKNHEIISLKALKISNEALKKDNESFRKTCEKLKEENERLNKSICAKGVLNGKLLKDYNAAQSAYEIMVEKSADLMDAIKKLEEENEKLKLDCEKLQHGYIDTDMIICGGRACGKQYKALVNLFKKLPQDKIEAAYREVYNTELPAWKKEFLNQMYGIYKESREKAELPITKREKMWDYILKEGRTPVYVERKDVHDFLEECQIAGIKWQSGKMPLETAPFNMSERNDGMYFFVMTSRTPNGFRHVMTWWVTAYNEDSKKTINYLPPMRWDLFEKGRLVVKVDYHNFADFYNKCEAEIGRKPRDIYTGTFTVYYKNGIFFIRPYKDVIPYAKKIVNWEDVR